MTRNRTTHARLLATLGLSSALMFTTGQALAGTGHDHSHEHNHGQEISATTPAAARKAWAQAQGASNKAVALNNLIARAEARRELLAELIKSNPAEVLRVAIPEEKQIGMPAQVLELLEQKVEVEGKLESIYEDYKDGSYQLQHFLNTPFGERFELKFAGKHPQHQGDSAIRANGVLLNSLTDEDSTAGTMALASADSSVETMACCDGTGSSISATPALDNTIGEQRTLIILMNYQDKPERPWSAAEVSTAIFGEVSNLYRESSFGKTWFSGDIYGWYTVPVSSTLCSNTSEATALARQAAESEGADLTAYQRIVYVAPKNACGYAGQAALGDTPSWAVLNGTIDPQVIAHELGHNLGLNHAAALDCDTATLGGDCRFWEYLDLFDTMGAFNAAHFNAHHKERLSWLGSGDSPPITTVTNSGSYSLETYETNGTGIKALKIPRGTDPVSGEPTWYYVESRQAIGFDSFLADFSNVLNGVLIRTTGMSPGGYTMSQLLDMTPASDLKYDWDDAALSVGQSFSDPEAGVTITTEWVDSAGAIVNVTLGAQSCVHNSPALTLSPAESQWVAPGTAVTYTVTVTNRDGNDCPAANIGLTVQTPSGWSASFAEPALTLSPGASGTTSLTVASAGTAADGFYDLVVSAHNPAGSGSSTSATVSYVISSQAANSAPLAVADSVTMTVADPLVIDVLANDQDPDGDRLSLLSVTQGSKGNVVINGDGTLTYSPGKRFKTSDSFSYTISDGSMTASATVTIQLDSSAEGGSKGGTGGNGKGKP